MHCTEGCVLYGKGVVSYTLACHGFASYMLKGPKSRVQPNNSTRPISDQLIRPTYIMLVHIKITVKPT